MKRAGRSTCELRLHSHFCLKIKKINRISLPFCAMSSVVSTPLWSLSNNANTYFTSFVRQGAIGGFNTLKNSLKSTVLELSLSKLSKSLFISCSFSFIPNKVIPSLNSIRLSLFEWSLSIFRNTVDSPMMLPPTLFFMHWARTYSIKSSSVSSLQFPSWDMLDVDVTIGLYGDGRTWSMSDILLVPWNIIWTNLLPDKKAFRYHSLQIYLQCQNTV